jgi:hypothetical protein
MASNDFSDKAFYFVAALENENPIIQRKYGNIKMKLATLFPYFLSSSRSLLLDLQLAIITS